MSEFTRLATGIFIILFSYHSDYLDIPRTARL